MSVFEFEYNLIFKAVEEYNEEFRAAKNKKKPLKLSREFEEVVYPYHDLIHRYITRATGAELNTEKKEECLAYLNFTLETDARLRYHFTGFDDVDIFIRRLYDRMINAKARFSDKIGRWLGAPIYRNRRWMSRHWDEAVSVVKSYQRAIERYERNHALFENCLRSLRQTIKDHMEQLEEEMDRHYGLSKL